MMVLVGSLVSSRTVVLQMAWYHKKFSALRRSKDKEEVNFSVITLNWLIGGFCSGLVQRMLFDHDVTFTVQECQL